MEIPKWVRLKIEKWVADKKYGDLTLHFWDGQIGQITLNETIRIKTERKPVQTVRP